MATGFTVYRVDYVTGNKVAIGCIMERRRRERGKNLKSLLQEARRVFSVGPSDSINIVFDSPKNSQEIREAGFLRCFLSFATRA